ncbi:TetR/AcrR family transcriptional regulator [Streptomyces boluensis]|uniref:TetR family transcriptional regulator n=1 Tax=Streptomyces boluensis TaxID=1775135 RepID=A0A964USR9_9ACTN|nr:TetR/AcrR family transcriptional regulator [Streptomyces boluensis]NBE54087.1 TetR family transcriptional regulator [Streptomyces boluensis]
MSESGSGAGAEASGAPPRKRRGAARQRLLDAAARRFYADGVAATGIDTITAEAGVAKMSLYNNFSSKSDLVRAYLDARHEEWLDLYRRRLEAADGGRGTGRGTGRDGVFAVFDAYADHAAHAYEHGFRGCGLLNAAAELPAGDEGRAVVRRHKEEVEALLAGHLDELLPERPEEARALAEHLAFLLEGAMTRAGLEGAGTRIEHARTIAADLLDRRL